MQQIGDVRDARFGGSKCSLASSRGERDSAGSGCKGVADGGGGEWGGDVPGRGEDRGALRGRGGPHPGARKLAPVPLPILGEGRVSCALRSSVHGLDRWGRRTRDATSARPSPRRGAGEGGSAGHATGMVGSVGCSGSAVAVRRRSREGCAPGGPRHRRAARGGRDSEEGRGAPGARRGWAQLYRALPRAQPGPERSGGTRPHSEVPGFGSPSCLHPPETATFAATHWLRSCPGCVQRSPEARPIEIGRPHA